MAAGARIAITPDTVQTVPLASLTPDPRNLRLHPDRSIAVLMAALTRFGLRKPIVIDGAGVIRAGNGVAEAARRLGWTEITVSRQPDLDGETGTAYAIADNRTAELSVWDHAALAEALAALQPLDFDLDALGWTADDVALCAAAAEPVPAAVPAAPAAEPPWPELVVTLAPPLYERWQERVREAAGDRVAAFRDLLGAGA